MKHRYLLHSLFAGLCLAATVSHAATNLVQMGDYFFNPTNLNIIVGDTVLWTNTSLIGHDTTSSTALWSSGNLVSHGTFSFKFTNAGTFPYLCAEHVTHGHPEMTGQVFVAAATLPPSISITNPANNARFLAPANVLIQAVVTNGVTATNVQFFRDGVLFATLPFAPYQASANNLVAGNYTFTAREVDNSGVASTSAPVFLQVLTNARLSGPIRGNTSFQFTVNAITGQTYVAEFSSNLTSWLPFATNSNATALFNFTNSAATNSPRYYRVRQDLQ